MGKDVGRTVLERPAEFGVRAGFVDDQIAHDQQRPPVAEDIEAARDGAQRAPVKIICACLRAHATVSVQSAAAISLIVDSMGVGCQSSTAKVAALSKAAFLPSRGSIPLASRSKMLISLIIAVGALREGTFV